MSTLAEIEEAADQLPRTEMEILYTHLGVRLGVKSNLMPPSVEPSRLAALDALQKRLALEAHGVREWQEAVQSARR